MIATVAFVSNNLGFNVSAVDFVMIQYSPGHYPSLYEYLEEINCKCPRNLAITSDVIENACYLEPA
jgi:hypothetical protein